MSTINIGLPGGSGVSGNTIADDLAALAGSTAVTFAADVHMTSANLGSSLPVFWNTHEFYLHVSDGAIRAGVKENDGSWVRFFSRDSTFADLASHQVELTLDSDTGMLRLTVDGRTVFERAGLDFDLPADLSGTQFGTAPGRADATANLANVSAATPAAPAAPPPMLSTLKDDGTVSLDFDTDEPPVGLTLKGDAVTGGNGTLELDGSGDFAVLTERYSLKNAGYLSIELDFRYADAADVGNARLVWNQGAFGIRVNDKSVSVMVTDGKGEKDYFWRGGLDFGDLEWHSVRLDIDGDNGALTLLVDDVAVIEQTGLSLSLPSTARQTTIGSDGWGSSLNGEIDNLTFTTERPQESALEDTVEGDPGENWDAVGLANPAIAMNTTGYIKWAQSTAATFIDRMKGAYAWTGKYEILYQDQGSYHIFRDASIFDNILAVEDVSYSSETLLNLSHLITAARWNKKLIDKAQQDEILANYTDYFKIETGADGNSELLGRLYETDEFSLLARFDTDIGMDMATLRANGQAWVKPSDMKVTYSQLDMDENGWLKSLPTHAAGGAGSASTIVMWYPEEAAQAPGNIYSGTFYLLAEGKGNIDLVQMGQSAGKVNLQGVEIDGPTMIPFEYTPDGQRVTLTLNSSDPDGTGEYIRNISIVHESHLDLFQAGEMFTPEFVELHADSRAVRWMTAQDANRIVPGVEDTFDTFHTADFYTFNQGTGSTPLNGVPVDAIVEFANKTGSDPWVNVHVNASDDYVRGMAEYIEANLDPRLTLHLEFGNENWNGVFPTYQVSKAEGLERWGELKLETDANGKFVRDANGDLIVLEDGFFFSIAEAKANGFKNLGSLSGELGLGHNLYSDNQAWAEWSSFRAVEVATIFDEVFTAADPDNADGRLNKVMGAMTNWSKSTDFLMQARVWQEAEPGNWIDPASVFDALAVAGYFGGTAGNKHSDMVRYWIDTYGEDKAAELLIRQLKKDVDPAINLIEVEAHHIATDNSVKAAGFHANVAYTKDLVIDVFDAIHGRNKALRNDIQSAEGLQGEEVLVAGDVHDYVRLETNAAGNTELQLRVDPTKGGFETVVEFDSLLSVTIEEMLEEGTLFVRSLPSIGESARTAFNGQKAKADAYGLDLIAYEGGQHLAAATWGVYSANLSDPTLTNFFENLNKSPEMGALYEYWFEAWQDAGGEMFAHYSDYGLASRYGSWGALEYLGEQHETGADTHRYDVLNDLNQQEAWWDEGRDPTAFLHGVTDLGTAGDDTLRGTSEEDILLGGDGDDLIQAGPGDDAVGGGAGANVIEAGSGDDVILLASAADVIDGGDGTDIIRLSSTMASLDLADLAATNVEAIDTRNNAETTIAVSTADVFAFSPAKSLTMLVETADTLELTGFAFKSAVPDGPGEMYLYEGQEGGETVSLEIITNIAQQPDIMLMA